VKGYLAIGRSISDMVGHQWRFKCVYYTSFT